MISKKALECWGETINDDESYKASGARLVLIKSELSALDAAHDPVIAECHAAHRAAIEAKKLDSAPLLAAASRISSAIRAYRVVLERRAIEEQDKMRRTLLEMEQERRDSNVEQLKAEGREPEATALAASPVYVPPVVLTPSTPKLEGVQERVSWKFEITDESLIPREYLMPDEKKIGGVVRAMKGETRIPGIRVFTDTSLRVDR